MHPKIQEYLQAVPDGLNSYPQALCKFAIIRSFATGTNEMDWKRHLPDPIQKLFDRTPPGSLLIPEIHAQCIFLAQEASFESSEAYVEHCEKRTRVLLGGPIYRSLFKMFSAKRVARVVGLGYGQFHKGSHCTLDDVGENHVDVSIQFPANAFTETFQQIIQQSLVIGLEIGGCKDVSWDWISKSSNSISTRTSWT